MLTNPINVNTEEKKLDFASAKLIADQKAKEVAHEPMLLSWYDSERGRFSPDVECCGEDKPAWLIYAESRGGNITIDVNDEQYVFIYVESRQE